MTLTVLDFSDREVLYKVADTLDNEGETTSKAVAISMGLSEKESRNVAIRLAWMKRFGVVTTTRRKDKETQWTLTPEGRMMLDGSLRAAAVEALRQMRPEQRVSVMEHLAQYGTTNPLWRTMMRRQWTTTSGKKDLK